MSGSPFARVGVDEAGVLLHHRTWRSSTASFLGAAVLWAGWPFIVRADQSILTRNLNMFTLIAMGTVVAWAYSAFATIAPHLLPHQFHGHDGAVAVYFEAAAVITVLALLVVGLLLVA